MSRIYLNFSQGVRFSGMVFLYMAVHKKRETNLNDQLFLFFACNMTVNVTLHTHAKVVGINQHVLIL